MKVFKAAAGLVAVLIVSIVVGIYIYLRSTVPEYEGQLIVPGIDAEVEIIRDAYGMPDLILSTSTAYSEPSQRPNRSRKSTPVFLPSCRP